MYYENFLQKLVPLYKKVFVIAGNHEYHYRTMNTTENMILDICNRNGAIYLNNNSYHIPDCNISIFGSTFWTYIPPEKYLNVKKHVGDYNKIIKFSPILCSKLYEKSRKILNQELNLHPTRKWIIMSHHCPKNNLTGWRWENSPLNCAWASDIPEADDSRIIKWVFGHSHTPVRVGKFLNNSVGYEGENKNINLNWNFEI
jgi:DNA repair exonuclease SbcCD nuclease subunit